MRLHARLAIAALAGAALLVPAAPAAATWTNPLPVSALDSDVCGTAVGIDGNGTPVAAYCDSGFMYVAARRSDGTMTPPARVGGNGMNIPQGPELATNAAGASAIAWTEDDGGEYRVHLRTRAPGGALGSDQVISQKGFSAGRAAVAIDAAGGALVAWDLPVQADNRVFTRSRAPDGTLGPVERLSGEHGFFLLRRLAAEPGGRAFCSGAPTTGPAAKPSWAGRGRPPACLALRSPSPTRTP
jgi:hypothetical protein